MEELRTDDEQVEALKKWWNENGKAILLGLIIGIAGLVGYQYWKTSKITESKAASNIYAEVVALQNQSDKKEFIVKANSLLDKYDNTSYATLTRFALAKQYAEMKQWESAVTPLEKIISNNRHDGFVHLARIRLASVLIQLNKLDEALALVNRDSTPEFQSMYAELEGDVYHAKGQQSQARIAYQNALKKLSTNDQRYELINMKLNSIPVNTKQGS